MGAEHSERVCWHGAGGKASDMRPPQSPGPRRGRTGRQVSGMRDVTRDDVRGDARLPSDEWAELLFDETEQLKEALERRPVIDLARGALMTVWSCTAEEAWQMLVWVSQHSNTKLHDVAEAVVATTQQEPMPAHLQEHLTTAVAQWRARRTE
ncbi:hypothetical protein GCM10010304_63930 [Streptomyces roseoviolaceus]